MKLNIEIELSDKEIEYMLFVKDYLECNPLLYLYDIPNYMIHDRNLTQAQIELYRKNIIFWNDLACGYETTYLFDEILKQISK